MSLNMYLGEVHTQTQSMNAVCTATIQGMEQAIQSIDAFAVDTVLQGQTYSSAKAFFVQTFRPLAQGIIYLCEELIHQNDAFPSQFQSQVATTDVIEQEILEQMRGINRTKASMEGISNVLPSMQAMVNIFDEMERKLHEKLEHLYQFDYNSSSNYDTAIQLASSIVQGLAEVQSGKGFSLASGTFSTQGLNMDWAAPIQEIIAKREAEWFSSQGVEDFGQSDFMKNDKSRLDQFKEGWQIGSGRGIGDEIEGFKALSDKETWEDMAYAALHPFNTLRTMCNALSDSYIKNVKNGDFEDAVIWFSYGATQFATGALFDKGIGKIPTVLKGSRFEKVKEVKVPRIQQTFTNLADSLSLENRLAFADTNGLNLKSFDNPMFNEAKDTFLFFDKYKSHPNSIYKNNATVEHIFHGNINKEGKAGGYHHQSMMGDGEILRIIRPKNQHGIYEAKVIVNGVPKGPTSTFFPDEWSRLEVLKSIETAYNNRSYTGKGNRYIGTTSQGIQIMLFIDKSTNRIISAFPIY
ncbi:cytoplasmic protein [Bacillus clarus]|uniref:Bacterial EndoU nuclease family protein n=1 Tax=Bacillus clarus TaxID=2338372 RepID=A0A090Z0L4_9BACI|nr:EndoU domain-containing protein [Bacillus clarus]KFN03705.1 bacterial EndoU nuclease family protein [Bacillus clarus]RFT63474.1 cytoplasmic protein [Bacillus clarus]